MERLLIMLFGGFVLIAIVSGLSLALITGTNSSATLLRAGLPVTVGAGIIIIIIMGLVNRAQQK